MISITQGNVCEPEFTTGKALIVHCVNDQGIMGSGVAKALYEKWSEVKTTYIDWSYDYTMQMEDSIIFQDESFSLGDIQIVEVEPNILVCNLIGQKNFGKSRQFGNHTIPPVRYEALFEGFCKIREFCEPRRYGDIPISIHLPLLGCALAGGKLVNVFNQYLKAFKNSTIKSTFYAFSDNDFLELQKVYDTFRTLPDWARTIGETNDS